VVTKLTYRFLEDRPRFAGLRVVFFFLFLEVIFLNPKTITSLEIVFAISNKINKRISIGYTSFPHQMRKGQS
jgi:hypothetical protein